MKDHFSQNLRYMCSAFPSIAHVCRGIGINRQQFNRYLNASGIPSAYNLIRIAQYFHISDQDFFLKTDLFKSKYNLNKFKREANPLDFLTESFAEQSGKLRKYLGVYHSHFCSPSWPDKILRAIIWLREESGYVISHSYERVIDSDNKIIQKLRYQGAVSYHGGYIYILEKAMSEDVFFSKTIMEPVLRKQINYVHGITLGVAARAHTEPFPSKIIWKKLPERISAREAIQATGIFDLHSEQIDPIVKNCLNPDSV